MRPARTASITAMAVACLLSPLPAAQAAVGPGYCPLPEDEPTGPDTVSWIYPGPPPQEPEPTAEQRRDYAGFPNAAVIDTVGPDGSPRRHTIVTYSKNIDVVMPYVSAAATSGDDGRTFGPSARTPLREAPIPLHDGRLFATEYYLTGVTAHTASLGILTSADGGKSWDRAEAVFGTPEKLAGGGVAHGRPIQLANGTILVTVYGRYADVDLDQSEVYASADGGASFTRRGVIGRPDSRYAYNEAAVEQVADGSLLAVLRREGGGAYATLAYSRSTDAGATWSPPQDLRLPGQDCLVRGVAPRLLLMPGGVLVLSAGRPDVWVALSFDGLGGRWDRQRVTYHNRDGIYDAHGTSGYSGIAAVGPYRLLQVFDNCKLPGARRDGSLNETACPAGNGFEHGSWYAIKRRHLDIPLPGPGRLNLAALHRSGKLTVNTTMTWTSRRRPLARPGGAFDGSTGYWSSAVSAGPGRYVLHLNRMRAFTRIGLSLRRGHAAGARVFVSRDGRAWGSPVLRVSGRTDYALRHEALATPVKGRHVKIEVDATKDCDPEIGATCAMLNEVELYAATKSS